MNGLQLNRRNLVWAEQSKAQQNQNVGLHCIQPKLALLTP